MCAVGSGRFDSTPLDFDVFGASLPFFRAMPARILLGLLPLASGSELRIRPAVERALCRPVVALEPTIISYRMPYPDNLRTAREVEEVVRSCGATPASAGKGRESRVEVALGRLAGGASGAVHRAGEAAEAVAGMAGAAEVAGAAAAEALPKAAGAAVEAGDILAETVGASGLSAPPVGSKAGTGGAIPVRASAAGCAPPVVVGGAVVDLVCLPNKGTALLPRTSTPGHLEMISGGVARNVADGLVRRERAATLATPNIQAATLRLQAATLRLQAATLRLQAATLRLPHRASLPHSPPLPHRAEPLPSLTGAAGRGPAPCVRRGCRRAGGADPEGAR